MPGNNHCADFVSIFNFILLTGAKKINQSYNNLIKIKTFNTLKTQKNKGNPAITMTARFPLFGDSAGIRTPDTLLKRQVLCLLSY
jgi:hypothetical protein